MSEFIDEDAEFAIADEQLGDVLDTDHFTRELLLPIGDRVIIDEKIANTVLMFDTKLDQLRAQFAEEKERNDTRVTALSKRQRWGVGIALFAAGFAFGSFVLSVIRIYYLGIERGVH